MELTVIIGLIVFAIILLSVIRSHSTHRRKVFQNNIYAYTAKSSVMTRTESEFFIKLDHAVKERYYVFPQVHLSSLLDHKVKGQEWKYAFSHINGKSVDYVLCDRVTLEPTYAIELDDYTHDRKDRRQRDIEVERIFDGVNIPLIRFSDKNISGEEIIRALQQSRK